MNLVSLLLLPAVISLRHNDNARYAIAAACLVVLGAAIAFSKRKAAAMDAPVGGAVLAVAPVFAGDRNEALKAAIDQWIFDLGHEEHELRDRLRAVKSQLDGGNPGGDPPAENLGEGSGRTGG
jgi:hypothetical protein